MRDALKQDMKHWKVKKIVANYTIFSRVESIFRKAFVELKEIFVSKVGSTGQANFKREHLLSFFE